MQKWEYVVIRRHRGIDRGKNGYHDPLPWSISHGDMEKQLNSLGVQGWELVAVMPNSDYGGETNQWGGPIVGGVTTSENWVFKRPIQ